MTYTTIGSPTPTVRLIFYTQKLMNYKLTAFTECEEIVKGEQYRFTVGGDLSMFSGEPTRPRLN